MHVSVKWFQEHDSLKSVMLVLGNFDGFHVGHLQLLEAIKKDTIAHNTQGIVVFFTPHPKTVLESNKKSSLSQIVPFTQYDQYIKKTGLHGYMQIQFDLQLAALSPSDFFQQLYAALPFRKLWVGEGFAFGKARKGNIETLFSLAKQYDNVEIGVCPVYKIQDEKVSSTKIRWLLAQSKFQEASVYLGRYWHFSGIVEKGKQLARQLGFPTLNLQIPFVTNLQYGVYVALIHIQGKLYHSVCNFGIKPTIGGTIPLWESHLLHVINLPEVEEIKIMPLVFLREEKKFASLDKLKQQLIIDVERAQNYFNRNQKLPQFE